ncbi:NACHT domain-containing protein [Plantactinospora sp. S1510]|uniref:NACHT domain-containing protein n=1 Tax=Plantactinospora alkalitolerans TaxID=2789879 RepID=A0ABS0H320_9ACTN|nr:NACHT domain-containing protein [Plantactinospora alkalitolerans]MBF9132534.1 NACHT domain-containing protein [Plantactinospora alkalitolerans]
MAEAEGFKRMAQSIVGGAFKVLFPTLAPRIDGLRDIASAMTKIKEGEYAARALPFRLEDAAERITDRLRRMELREFGKLDENERSQAIEGVIEALDVINVDPETVLQEALTVPEIRRRLTPVARQRWQKQQLSDQGQAYGRLFLHESCSYLHALVRDLPGFDSKVAWETYILTRKIDEVLDRAITSVIPPLFPPGATVETGRLEADYRTDITSTHQYTDLFGVALPPELRQHPVEVAYIRLRSTEPTNGTDRYEPERPEPSRQVDVVLGRILRDSTRVGGHGSRILITGAAGSGKTTIAQWLAITLAARNPPATIAPWKDCVPFMVPLRRLFLHREQPTYESLVIPSADRGQASLVSWATTRLDTGDAVVIFDGFDEVPDHDRLVAADWIGKLIVRHPKAHFVMTSRPDHLDRRWFLRHHFRHLSLLPMNPEEALECIHRWFHALLTSTPVQERLEYKRRRDQLLHDFHTRPAVRDLSETPLMCAMLCAFYANRIKESVPRTRIDLYRRVVAALIDLRDRDRNLRHSAGSLLDYNDKKLLLQAIARHMSDASASSIRIQPLGELISLSQEPSSHALDIAGTVPERLHDASALDIVADQLRAMLAPKLEASHALDYLLRRSVVFRQVASNEAQFAHRSLQEFLTGSAYAYDGDVTELLARATSAEWHRVLVFASGTARNRKTATAIIKGLLTRAEKHRDQRRVMLLLAAECMGAARQVELAVAEKAREVIREVLPPRNLGEARLLVGLGEETLNWLRYQPGTGIDVAQACIWTASRIGGPTALEILVDYANSPLAQALAAELVDAWEWFDPEEYADRVLASLPLGQTQVTIHGTAQLRALPSAPTITSVRLDAAVGIEDLRAVGSAVELRELDCGQVATLRSLAGLSALPRLGRLNLSGNKLLADVSELGRATRIRELYLGDCVSVSSLDLVAALSDLRVLVLDGCLGIADLGPVGQLHRLQTLSVDGCSFGGLEFCRPLSALRTLRARPVGEGVEDAGGVAGCHELRRLSLKLAPGRTVGLPKVAPTLRHVELAGHVTQYDVRALLGCPQLSVLSTSAVEGGRNLDFLEAFPELARLAVVDSTGLVEISGLANCPEISHLDLSGSGVENLSTLSKLRRLRHLRLDRCRSLSDISALHALPELEYVSLDGVPGVLHDAILRLRSRAVRPVAVYHDPYPALADRVDFGVS